MLQNDPLWLPPFHFNSDPDPAFQFDADPDLDPDSAFHFPKMIRICNTAKLVVFFFKMAMWQKIWPVFVFNCQIFMTVSTIDFFFPVTRNIPYYYDLGGDQDPDQ
jgi:hypothetical protein